MPLLMFLDCLMAPGFSKDIWTNVWPYALFKADLVVYVIQYRDRHVHMIYSV